MAQITVSKNEVEKQKGVVILPLRQYRELVRGALPTYYLDGKEASKLDRLVNDGLKELKAGKTKKIKTLADLR
jgi:hypothetical protein